jgi:hypothetical protein
VVVNPVNPKLNARSGVYPSPFEACAGVGSSAAQTRWNRYRNGKSMTGKLDSPMVPPTRNEVGLTAMVSQTDLRSYVCPCPQGGDK